MEKIASNSIDERRNGANLLTVFLLGAIAILVTARTGHGYSCSGAQEVGPVEEKSVAVISGEESETDETGLITKDSVEPEPSTAVPAALPAFWYEATKKKEKSESFIDLAMLLRTLGPLGTLIAYQLDHSVNGIKGLYGSGTTVGLHFEWNAVGERKGWAKPAPLVNVGDVGKAIEDVTFLVSSSIRF